MMNDLLILRVTPSAPAINIGPHKDVLLDVFFALFILGGQVGLPIVLLTMLLGRSDGRRRYTLFNFLVSWMLYAISMLLLLVPFRVIFEKPADNYNIDCTEENRDRKSQTLACV